MIRNPVAPVPWLLSALWQAQDQGGQAYTVTVYKMAPCPCGATPESPNNINCAACGGTGFLYPTPPRETVALVSQIDLHTHLMEQGLAQPGDLLLSTQPGAVHLDPFDLCLIRWGPGLPVTGEVLVRGTGATDHLPYRAVTVEGAWTVDSATGQITTYALDRDFTVTDHTVTWIGRAPAAGTSYTLRYSADFEWVVFDPPDQRLAFGVDLGQRVIVRKRFLVLPNAPRLLQG